MPDGQAGATWHWHPDSYGEEDSGISRLWIEGQGVQGFYCSPDLPTWLVDAIIADHEAAAHEAALREDADALAALLDRIIGHEMVGLGNLEAARLALAKHAALSAGERE